MYLKEMGNVELLSREGEIAIAKRIESGLDKMMNSILECPASIDILKKWIDQVKLQEINLREIVDFDEYFNEENDPYSNSSKRKEIQKIINDKNVGVEESSTDFIESWVDIAKPGLSKINFSNEKENLEVVSERAVLLYSYSNLLTYPWIHDAVNKKSLDIHAWWLDFKTVKLWKKSQGNDTFIPIEF